MNGNNDNPLGKDITQTTTAPIRKRPRQGQQYKHHHSQSKDRYELPTAALTELELISDIATNKTTLNKNKQSKQSRDTHLIVGDTDTTHTAHQHDSKATHPDTEFHQAQNFSPCASPFTQTDSSLCVLGASVSSLSPVTNNNRGLRTSTAERAPDHPVGNLDNENQLRFNNHVYRRQGRQEHQQRR